MAVHLKPLAIAANIAQGATARLDHVLLTLGNLYRIFLDEGVDPSVWICIHTSLEKRWKGADQAPFLAAVFLNPYIKHHLFNDCHGQLTFASLHACLRRLLTRVFPNIELDDINFYEACDDYYNRVNEYDRERMNLDTIEKIYKKEVSTIIESYKR